MLGKLVAEASSPMNASIVPPIARWRSRDSVASVMYQWPNTTAPLNGIRGYRSLEQAVRRSRGKRQKGSLFVFEGLSHGFPSLRDTACSKLRYPRNVVRGAVVLRPHRHTQRAVLQREPKCLIDIIKPKFLLDQIPRG